MPVTTLLMLTYKLLLKSYFCEIYNTFLQPDYFAYCPLKLFPGLVNHIYATENLTDTWSYSHFFLALCIDLF